MRLVVLIMFGAACRSSAPARAPAPAAAPEVPSVAPLANTPEPTHAEQNAKLECHYESGGDTVRIDGDAHSIDIEVCEGPWRDHQREEEVRLVFGTRSQSVQRQVITSWVRHIHDNDDDDNFQVVMFVGVLTEKSGDAIVIAKHIHDQGDRWIMTAYAWSQGGWNAVAETRANFLEVVDKTKDMRGVLVRICGELDYDDCDKPTAKVRFEDWYWDGRVVQRLPARRRPRPP